MICCACFQLDAFRTPSLKRQVEKSRLYTEKLRLECKQLEESLSQTRVDNVTALEQERARFKAEISEILEQHQNELVQGTSCIFLQVPT